MSPLARSLLALACATLLHASSVDKWERFRSQIPDWNEKWPCAALDMGIENDTQATKVLLEPFRVPIGLINIPSIAKPDESILGQHLHVCDVDGKAENIIVESVSVRKHSPVRVNCFGSPFYNCQNGVVVFPAQFVIKKLL